MFLKEFVDLSFTFQTILFTLDEEILEKVAANDDSYDSVMNEAVEPTPQIQPERPLTADVGVILYNDRLNICLFNNNCTIMVVKCF